MQVRVDRRVELLSILFHLSGAEEYRGLDTPYRAAVDEAFAALRDHPAVASCRELRRKFGISYDAPVALAVSLDEELRLREQPGDRWRGAPVEEFLEQVRDFAAHASGFFDAQSGTFAKIEERISTAIAGAGIGEWFSRALGDPRRSQLVVVPGLLTGRWSYGATARDEIFQIVCLEDPDAEGLPRPTALTTGLVAHELAHSYVNPIVDLNERELTKAAGPIFERSKEAMRRHKYPSPKILVAESLVRAVAGFFTRDVLGEREASQLLRRDEASGFTWIRDLARWLERHPKPFDLQSLAQPLALWFSAA
jgi:Domain of unknown function (DUF4932)